MRQKVFGATLAGLFVAGTLFAQAASLQTGSKALTLATVHIPHAVEANGQPLAAGTYTLRLSDETPPPVVGEAENSEQWVEFVQRGQVKGKEVASVVQPDAVKDVVNSDEAPPKPGMAKVQMLKGNQYLRVWINKGGVMYLVHLVVQG